MFDYLCIGAYLPDTNVWIRHLDSKPSRVKERLAAYDPNDVLLCDIVKAELYYGAFKSARPADNLAVLKSLFASFESVPFTGDTARVFGKLRSDLAQQGSPIGPLDLQIASIAALNGLILVTSNTREFTRISGLQVEDWSV
ncbi:MAG TPA: type II toxin-antitoxin system VapC family toxin [Planctomycetaceae bacterium]|nr:type II toxin-antitoxin system VapC family toxin [Planctomycetaceae bacterium]